MLTKDLVRFQSKGSRVAPDFIDPADPGLLALAEQLLDVFKSATGLTRGALEVQVEEIVEGHGRQPLICKGLVKLLLDRVEFDTAPNEETTAFRAQLFAKSSELLTERSFDSPESYQEAVANCFGLNQAEIVAQLYSDLPENQPAREFRALSPERLLHRYNCALVQWLLLQAHSLEIQLPQPDPARSRALLRHMRFQQLLAEIAPAKDGSLSIVVDGPLNLFRQTKKYGMQLANFFPSVLNQSNWRLRAQIGIGRGHPKLLSLDQTCGLQPYSGGFLGYTPPEVQMFQELFVQKSQDWIIGVGTEFLALPLAGYSFPDFVLKHRASELEVSLELFHPWHAKQVQARLQQVESSTTDTLVLGVALKVAKDPDIALALENSAYFQRCGFTFREMPSPSDIEPILRRLLGLRRLRDRPRRLP